MNQININNTYQQLSVHTSSPVRLIIMLYDGAIRFLNQAKIIMEKKESRNGITWYEESHINLNKAHNIILALLSNLNFKEGGEVSLNLRGLYLFLIDKIVEIDLSKKNNDMNVVLNILISLKSAWEEIDKKDKIEKTKVYPQVNNINAFKEARAV